MWLSRLARTLKARLFLRRLSPHARILEVGSGDGWVGDWFRTHGYGRYVGLDLRAPADVVGSILDWQALGLQAGSFDVIVAFEVVEHVDCLQACWDLLRPGGVLLLTTPLPEADGLLQRLERAGLNQPRTSPHDHLVHLRTVPWRGQRRVRVVAGLSQWGWFTKGA